MKLKQKNGVKYLTFESFERVGGVCHAFSTKVGGVSDGAYAEMNLGYSSGDKKENVLKNFEIFSEAVGFDIKNIVFSDQVHKADIRHIKRSDAGKGLFRESDIRKIDALITNDTGVILTTFYADCVPLFFLDTEARVVALAHAGWRGTVMEIGGRVVDEMHGVYGCDPKDITVGIGACLGECCFEVDEDVYNEFSRLSFSAKFITKRSDKYDIDLKGVNKQTLLNAGICLENIEVSDMCTKCNSDLFYSHRLTGNPRGSMAAFVGLEATVESNNKG